MNRKSRKKVVISCHAKFVGNQAEINFGDGISEALMLPQLDFISGYNEYLDDFFDDTKSYFREAWNIKYHIIGFGPCVDDVDFYLKRRRIYGFELAYGACKQGKDCLILVKFHHEFHVLVFKNKSRRMSQVLKDLLVGKYNHRLPGKNNPEKNLFKHIFMPESEIFQDSVESHVGSPKEELILKAA